MDDCAIFRLSIAQESTRPVPGLAAEAAEHRVNRAITGNLGFSFIGLAGRGLNSWYATPY